MKKRPRIIKSILSYNAIGALTEDPSRGITSIVYDNLGNPTSVKYTESRRATNVYSATGERLKTVNVTNVTLMADASTPFDTAAAYQATESDGSAEPEESVESASSAEVTATGIPGFSTTEYHGPVIYRDSKVDKVLFPGGYATVSGSTVTFHYYTQDYLGNNRADINGSTGAIEQTVAYYPYGAVIADLGTPTTGQPYKFGGKELITANGLNEYDFGARYYYSAVPGFTKPDPMAEKYYWLSPYLYCANNPVNNTDPTGMYVVKESQKEWNRNKNDIQKRRNSLQSDIDNTKAKGAKKGWSAEKIAKKIGDKQDRVASLDKTLSTMSTIENSEQGYALSSNNNNNGQTSLRVDGIIDINYHKGSVALFCHEVTHAGQFETGDIAFGSEKTSYLNDVLDEVDAFRAQYAYDPGKVDGLNSTTSVKSIFDINADFVVGIGDSINGYPYAPGGENNVGRVRVRIDSPIQLLLDAFPNHSGYINFVNNNRFITQLPNIYYKR